MASKDLELNVYKAPLLRRTALLTQDDTFNESLGILGQRKTSGWFFLITIFNIKNKKRFKYLCFKYKYLIQIRKE